MHPRWTDQLLLAVNQGAFLVGCEKVLSTEYHKHDTSSNSKRWLFNGMGMLSNHITCDISNDVRILRTARTPSVAFFAHALSQPSCLKAWHDMLLTLERKEQSLQEEWPQSSSMVPRGMSEGHLGNVPQEALNHTIRTIYPKPQPIALAKRTSEP
eukprot:5014818-Amphidinium_carterae.1